MYMSSVIRSTIRDSSHMEYLLNLPHSTSLSQTPSYFSCQTVPYDNIYTVCGQNVQNKKLTVIIHSNHHERGSKHAVVASPRKCQALKIITCNVNLAQHYCKTRHTSIQSLPQQKTVFPVHMNWNETQNTVKNKGCLFFLLTKISMISVIWFFITTELVSGGSLAGNTVWQVTSRCSNL